MFSPRGRHALVATGLLFIAPTLRAQLGVQKERNVPSVYAITNARIVAGPGQSIAKGNVIVRNGLIAAVGATAAIPADARVVDASGLTIYPGLVDSYSNLGYEAPAVQQQGGGRGAPAGPQVRVDPAPNSLNRVGLQPEVSALTLLVDNADYTAAQNAGFATALTAPPTGIFVGQSAVISLRKGDVQSILLKTPVGMHIGFGAGGRGGGGGGYPGSLMGVFAALRQTLLDAQRYALIQAAYAANPRSMARPENDPSLAALQPALKGDMKVYFNVNTEREIERALDLAKEFGLKPVVVGGQEAHLVIDRLKAENVPVLYSLSFSQPGAGNAGGGRGGRGGGAADDAEPIRMLRQRVQEPKTPSELQKAGVMFALQQGGNGFGQFLANLQRVTAEGLSKDDALRALTITPATLFGVADRVGTIEAGKIADLTITRGDLFEPGVKVTQLFVDGQPVELQPATNAPVAATPAAGTWNLTVTVGGAERQATLTLTQEGNVVRGTLQGGLGTVEIGNGTINQAGTLRFTSSITMNTTEEATFTGTITGDAISGTITVVGDPAGGKFTGTRNRPTRPEEN